MAKEPRQQQNARLELQEKEMNDNNPNNNDNNQYENTYVYMIQNKEQKYTKDNEVYYDSLKLQLMDFVLNRLKEISNEENR